MRILCWLLLSLLLSSRSETHQGAGAVAAMSVKAQQEGWCPHAAGQRASLFVPWSDVRDAAALRGAEGPLVSRVGQQRVAAFGSSASEVQGQQGQRRGSLGGTRCWEGWRKVSGWSQGGERGGRLLCVSLPLAACLLVAADPVQIEAQWTLSPVHRLWSSARGRLH